MAEVTLVEAVLTDALKRVQPTIAFDQNGVLPGL